jgi:glycosyltransferase involved in cell wall biosynthesis
VGRLQPWKGQHRFLRALAALRARGHNLHGLVVGGNAYGLSPGYEEWLHKLALELGIENSVTFTGHVPQAGPYLQLMDVSVNASIGEPFGLVLLEAMALRVPVVAFGLGGPAEIVDSGRSGILVPVGDEQALSAEVERLVVDLGFREQIGQWGYERFRTMFSAERMALQMERRLQELACA